MARRRTPLLVASLGALGALLGGCSTRTNVSATGNSPALYTHVYVTAQAVWFNSSASAGPADGGWVKFTPTTPVTLDLVADSGGNFANLATDLKLSPGSYAQMRLIPVDASMPLTVSAQTLGAKYNMEADCLDGSGVTHQLPLELLNPDQGLGIQTSLSVPVGNIGAAFGALSSTSTAAPFGTTGTTTASTTSSSASPQTTTAEFALAFDGARDLTAFNFGGTSGVCGGTVNGVLLSSHVSAYDLSRAGGIQGQLTLTNLTLPTSANGTTGLEVNAEVLSADGTRHLVVARAPVASDGNFTLYPLAASASNNTSYDVVIHDECAAGISDEKTVDAVLAPHRAGIPGVNLHCAMHCYRDGTDEWFKFCGVTSRRHGAAYAHEVLNRDPQHPIMEKFGPAWANPAGSKPGRP